MRYTLVSLILVSGLFFSCSSDNEDEIHYDGNNFSAPLLTAGTQELGARFPSIVVEDYSGKSLEAISFYLQDLPDAGEVKIYEGGSNLIPGAVIYSGNFVGQFRSNSWNIHTLASPILLTDKELWITIELELNTDRATLGCDEGPADTNGDFMFDTANSEWSTLRALTNGETNINWNIRGILGE